MYLPHVCRTGPKQSYAFYSLSLMVYQPPPCVLQPSLRPSMPKHNQRVASQAFVIKFTLTLIAANWRLPATQPAIIRGSFAFFHLAAPAFSLSCLAPHGSPLIPVSQPRRRDAISHPPSLPVQLSLSPAPVEGSVVARSARCWRCRASL